MITIRATLRWFASAPLGLLWLMACTGTAEVTPPAGAEDSGADIEDAPPELPPSVDLLVTVTLDGEPVADVEVIQPGVGTAFELHQVHHDRPAPADVSNDLAVGDVDVVKKDLGSLAAAILEGQST